MVKFVDEQSDADRLRAVNAELLASVRTALALIELDEKERGITFAGCTLRAAIAKATNQEAGR